MEEIPELSDSIGLIKSLNQTENCNLFHSSSKKLNNIRKISLLVFIWLLIILDLNNYESQQNPEKFYVNNQEKITYDDPLYDIVLPVGPNYNKNILAVNLKMLKKFFKTKIIFLAPVFIKEEIMKLCNDCEFVDETTLYPGLNKNKIKEYLNTTYWAKVRHKWFYQQFLKMAYAFNAKKEYYFIIDYDTIPINNFSLFNPNNSKPFFSYSCDSWRNYFKTMKKLFNFEKQFNYSYVCELMMFKSSIMKEIVQIIEKKNDLKGKYFYEKILDASKGQDVGFSEYETYGTYVYNYYPDLYEYKHLRKSDASDQYFPLDEEIFEYAAKSYDTLRYEKEPDGKTFQYMLVNNNIFRKLFKVHDLYKERNYETECKYISSEEEEIEMLKRTSKLK